MVARTTGDALGRRKAVAGTRLEASSPQASALKSLGWEVKAVVVAHCDTLTSATTAPCERVAAAHRLNELFASCQFFYPKEEVWRWWCLQLTHMAWPLAQTYSTGRGSLERVQWQHNT